MSTSGGQAVQVQPPMQEWLAPLASKPTPVIMTGHQAEFWHPGVLAKYVAADEAARQLRARGVQPRVVWLVVDQDSNEPWNIAYPAISAEVASPHDGAPRRLSRQTWPLKLRGKATASSAVLPDTPTACVPVIEPPEDVAAAVRALHPALPSVEYGLQRIADSLRAHMGKPNAARQVIAAVCDLLSPALRPDEVIYASELSRGAPFAGLLENIRRDPERCVAAYNQAVAESPEARLRPLQSDGSRVELPLWQMPESPGSPRRAVDADTLESAPTHSLAPRALLMTALVRRSMCDLFIHGTGGGIYDRVMEQWVELWMPGETLAPMAVVTATRTLDFGGPAPLTAAERAHVVWMAHAATHNPGLVGDKDAAAQKRMFLERVRTARARGEDPRDEFRAMHAALATARAGQREQLEGLAAEARAAQADAGRAAVMHDRTWPFALYGDGLVEELREALARVGA